MILCYEFWTFKLLYQIMEEKPYQTQKNEDDLDTSEAPPPGSKLLSPYVSPFQTV